MHRRSVLLLRAAALLAALTVSGLATPAAASFAAPVTAVTASADSDGDSIPDAVERIVCGSATCADGTEDADRDGIPDWTEVLACDTARCASPRC
jgi:hypothetical protein